MKKHIIYGLLKI